MEKHLFIVNGFLKGMDISFIRKVSENYEQLKIHYVDDKATTVLPTELPLALYSRHSSNIINLLNNNLLQNFLLGSYRRNIKLNTTRFTAWMVGQFQ